MKKVAVEIGKLGAKHIKVTHGKIVRNETHKLVTTPCYLPNTIINKTAYFADNQVKKVTELI